MTEVHAKVEGVLSLQFVGDGETVSAGEEIGYIEIMKMTYPIAAPVTGTLQWKRKLGEVVNENDVLAVIE